MTRTGSVEVIMLKSCEQDDQFNTRWMLGGFGAVWVSGCSHFSMKSFCSLIRLFGNYVSSHLFTAAPKAFNS